MKIFSPLLLVIISVYCLSCQKQLKEDLTTPGQGGVDSLAEQRVQTSIKVLVLDESESLLANAKVELENKTAITNEFGYAEFKDAMVISGRAMVKISAAGYFDAYRTFPANSNEFYGRIKLTPRNATGIVNISGGQVAVTAGTRIIFPANALANADSTAFTGIASVYAQYLSPESSDFNTAMPGDLVGSDNGNVVLSSYGMLNVEIQSSSGQPLKVRENVKVTLQSTIPASLAGSAPATIPMWYFDTKKGIWIKEGSATRQGNMYVAEVSHFTWWNFDYRYPSVFIDGKLLDKNGNPVVNSYAKLFGQAENIQLYALTNNNGYFKVAAPATSGLLLSFFAHGCNTSLHTISVNTTGSDIHLGSINVPASAPSQYVLSGTLQTCNNGPVQSGSLKVYCQNNMFEGKITNGKAAISFLFCSDSIDALIVAEDASTGKIYTASKTLYSNIQNNIGTQNICGDTNTLFIRYIVDNHLYYITEHNADSLSCHYFYHGGSLGADRLLVEHDNYANYPTITSKIYFDADLDKTGVVHSITIPDYPLLKPPALSYQITNHIDNYVFVPGSLVRGTVSGIMVDPAINDNRKISISYCVRQSRY